MRGLLAACEATRAEDGGSLLEGDFQALEELADRRFVGGEEARRFGLKLEVKIPHGPADAGSGRGCEVERDFDDRLGVLVHRIACSGGLKEGVAVLQRSFELKAELGSVNRGAPPKAFGERESFDPQGDFGE